MATSQIGSNMAFEAFRMHFEELLTAIQEPEVLAAGLFTRSIITKNIMDEVSVQSLSPMQKKMRLLSFVTDQITVDPSNFDKFMGALKKQPSAVKVAERLQNTYCTLSGQLSTQMQPNIGQCTTLYPVPSSHPNMASITQLTHALQSVGQFPTPSQQQPPSGNTAIETYSSYLKFDVYLRQKFPTYGKWPPNPSKKFINLALIKKQKMSEEQTDHFTKQIIRGNIDDIIHEKESISMEEIGKASSNALPKCILVEGAPGVGKSTFAWELCRKWSKGKLLQQYRLVVLLRLRDKRVREAKTVSDLFYHYNCQIQQAVVEDIRATGGRGVLLLFEGYDELPTKLCTKKSIFMDIIKGQEFPVATVLITSRPSASGPLYEECRDFIVQHVVILGFTHESIQLYLESTVGYDTSLLQGLQQYLTYYPHIRSMLYIPLNCAIVVEVYRIYKRSKSLIPKTWTDLYSSLLRSLLFRYLDDHPVYERQSWKTNNFTDLPADVYRQLCELCRIAYEGILEDQHVIFSDLPSDFNSLGLMQCVPELYVDKVSVKSFNFLHRTLQEYMAALHLSEQPVEEQIEVFQNYRQQTQIRQISTLSGLDQDHNHKSYSNFQTVLRFLAGMKKFTDYPIASIRLILMEHEDALLEMQVSHDSRSNLPITLDGLHWIFEAHDTSNICEAIEMSTVTVDISGTVNLFDYFVLGYCVSHSNCPWEIDLGGCGVGDEEVEMLVRGAMEGEAKHSGYVSVISITNNEITSTGLNQLLKIPKLLNLKALDLSGNPLGRGGAVLLLRSPIVHKLEGLGLSKTEIGVEDCYALSALLSSSVTLQKIFIADNALPAKAVELIITGLQHHTVLEVLNIRGSHFNVQNCILLASVTQPPRHLYLQDCCIDADGAIEVARLISHNTVTKLDLQGNPIGYHGATALAEQLAQNTSLRRLNMRHISIGLEGTQKLIDSLSSNSVLEELWLPAEYELYVNTTEVDWRARCYRIKWSSTPYQHSMKLGIVTSEPPPVTLPSSFGEVMNIKSGTREEVTEDEEAMHSD